MHLDLDLDMKRMPGMARSMARSAAGTLRDAIRSAQRAPHAARSAAETARSLTSALGEAGLLRPVRPSVAVRSVRAIARHGPSPAAAYEYAAARFADERAVVDERGTLSFDDLAHEVSRTAAVLAERGIGRESRVGVLCRNNRDFVIVVAALSSTGAGIVLMNTAFAGPQLAESASRERLSVLIHDAGFAATLATAVPDVQRFSARCADGNCNGCLAHLAPGWWPRPPWTPQRTSRYVVLTSGTTGAPTGTSRSIPVAADPFIALLNRIPVRLRDRVLIAPPLFHGWGFGHLGIGMLLSSTVVLQEHFDPEAVLAAVARERVRVLAVVPFMLQRIVDLPPEVRRRYDTSSLEVVASSGSQLPGPLAQRFMDAFGDVLYNVYGSTEAAWGAIATPADLRAAPGTAGRVPRGTEVRILDARGEEVATGGTGEIAIRNAMLVTSYSDGSTGRTVDGYLPTRDRGHFDADGRLFVEGRVDDMIVSGGENVHPQEVEELLLTHPAIADVVVTGVVDEDYGERLRATVVRKPGSSLNAAQVKAFVRERLARYKVPRDVAFTGSIERSATGKFVRRPRS